MTARALWGRDLAELLAPSGPRRQPLRGFDPVYADIIDYIIRCTWRIWEGRGLDLIRSHYAEDCPVHTMAGPVRGAETVIRGTAATLAAFPDRTLVGEAVIWSGDEDAGFLSSHRITSHATNLGASEFGPATRRRISFTTIADCLCRENRIVEEWLVRDNAAIVRKLGLDVAAIAAAQAERERANGPGEWRLAAMAEVRDRAARAGSIDPDTAPDPVRDPEAFARAFFAGVIRERAADAVAALHAPYVRTTLPDERRPLGHAATLDGWRSTLQPFGDARFTLDHVGAVDEGPYRDIALRWSMTGSHTADGRYGPASGRDVYILAVTHLRTLDGAITESWTIFDELALRRQIAGGL